MRLVCTRTYVDFIFTLRGLFEKIMNMEKSVELLLSNYSNLKKSNDRDAWKLFFNDLVLFEEEKIFEFTIRSECYKGSKGKYFWVSDIPHKIFSILLKSPEAKIVLKRYFEKDENVNVDFVKYFSEKHPKEFYITYRESKIYLKSFHFESTSFLEFAKDHNLYKLRYETEYIKKYLEYISKKEEYYFALLKNYTIEEIIIHIVSYFTSYEHGSEEYNNNSNHNADVIHNVVSNLPIILKEKLKTEDKILAKMGKEKFIERLLDEFPKIKSNEFIELRKKNWYSKPPENESTEKKIVREVIDFYIYKSYIINLFNNYSIGLYDFIDIDGLNSVIEGTPELGNYRVNDMKIIFEENYLNISPIQFKESEVANNINQNLVMVKQFLQLYEIPEKFKFKEKDLEFEDIFKVLYNFSFKLKPLGRNYFGVYDEKEQFENIKFIEKDHEDYEFKKIFDNYEICIFKKGELIKKIHNYFKWSMKYSEEIVEFLTLNLEEDFDPNFYPSKPLIYHGDYYYWVSKLLKNMNWRNILFARIIKERIYNINDQTNRLEKKLENEFKKNGFTVLSGNKFTGDKNKAAGDLDVCAYKDGYLFLIEMKMTYFTSDTYRIYNYEEEQVYSYKASKQLEKGLDFIKRNVEIQKMLGIESIDKTHIFPLIVSTTFFSDDASFHSKFLKISLLEMIIILNNSLRRLIKVEDDEVFRDIDYSFLFAGNNSKNSEFNYKFNENIKEDYNLWANKKECSGEDLYLAIKEDKVWSNFKKFFKPYKPYQIQIKKFEENYKLLHI